MSEDSHDVDTTQDEQPVWRSGPLVGLFFALLGGVLVFFLLQELHPVFTNPDQENAFGILPDDVKYELDRNNSVFVLALLGGILAAGLGVAEGLCRKSFATILVGGVVSAVLGAVLGGATGYLGLTVFQHYDVQRDMTDLAKAVRVFGILFASLGAAVGLTVGIVLTRRFSIVLNCLVAGILGGLLAGILFPVACALALPGASTKVLIPNGVGERLLWCGLSAGLIGAIIPAFAASGFSRKKKPPENGDSPEESADHREGEA